MRTEKVGGVHVAKLCGSDVELGNFVLGAGTAVTAAFASRALLREIDGFAGREPLASGTALAFAPRDALPAPPAQADPQDWGRKFLAGGGCAYVDLDHLELATPECRSAREHVAAWHAMLRVAQRALGAANARLPEGCRIEALANNSDGNGNAYGAHTSVLVARRAWEQLFERRMHHLLFLASYQVSSIVFTGQGKVGAENGASPVDFQITQRGDFFETLLGPQTTYRRPIVNARDEALSGAWGARAPGPRRDVARLHCIFYDATLAHVASFLRVGVLQLVLALIEAGRVDTDLILDDPIDALGRWGHDPDLTARARTTGGRRLTAVELQLRFLERVQRFVEGGGCAAIVPDAAEIVALWADTLDKLRRHDEEALAPRLDWVLKRTLLRRALERRPGLSWRSAEIKMLDHLYASLDPGHGLYWAAEAGGATEQVVTPEHVALRVAEPPDDTRAFGRAMLLRAAGEARVEKVDWDLVRVACGDPRRPDAIARVDLPDPCGFGRAAVGRLFDGTRALPEILRELGAQVETAPPGDRSARVVYAS